MAKHYNHKLELNREEGLFWKQYRVRYPVLEDNKGCAIDLITRGEYGIAPKTKCYIVALRITIRVHCIERCMNYKNSHVDCHTIQEILQLKLLEESS